MRIYILLFLTITTLALPQAAKMYRKITLLDFESTTTQDFKVQTSARLKPLVHWHNEFPAPIKRSKRYLGLEVISRTNDSIVLTFKKPIILTRYCKQINIWVYGTFNSGKVSLRIQDTRKNTGTLYLGILKYRGWRELTAKVPRRYAQTDHYVNSKTPFKITQLIYHPGSVNRLKKTQYIFIDDITAHVRPRYLLR